MGEMEDVSVRTSGSWKIIEITFKYELKQRNKGFRCYIRNKFYPMISCYLEEICQDTVAKGNVQFLKIWNKIGRRRI